MKYFTLNSDTGIHIGIIGANDDYNFNRNIENALNAHYATDSCYFDEIKLEDCVLDNIKSFNVFHDGNLLDTVEIQQTCLYIN